MLSRSGAGANWWASGLDMMCDTMFHWQLSGAGVYHCREF